MLQDDVRHRGKIFNQERHEVVWVKTLGEAGKVGEVGEKNCSLDFLAPPSSREPGLTHYGFDHIRGDITIECASKPSFLMRFTQVLQHHVAGANRRCS